MESAVGFSGLATTLMLLGFLLILGLDTWNTMFAFALIIVPFAEIAQGIVIGKVISYSEARQECFLAYSPFAAYRAM